MISQLLIEYKRQKSLWRRRRLLRRLRTCSCLTRLSIAIYVSGLIIFQNQFIDYAVKNDKRAQYEERMKQFTYKFLFKARAKSWMVPFSTCMFQLLNSGYLDNEADSPGQSAGLTIFQEGHWLRFRRAWVRFDIWKVQLQPAHRFKVWCCWSTCPFL